MRMLIATLSLLLTSIFGLAQADESSPAPPASTFTTTILGTPVKEKIQPSVSVLYNTSSEIESVGNQPDAEKKVAGSEPAMGLSIQAEKMFTTRLGVVAGLDYEFPRQINTFTYSYRGDEYKINFNEFEDTPTLSMLTFTTNLKYQMTSRLYLLGGINHSFPSLKNIPPELASGSDSSSGRIGFQAGVGAGLTDEISAEVAYRVLNMNLDNSFSFFGLPPRSSRMAGITAQARVRF